MRIILFRPAKREYRESVVSCEEASSGWGIVDKAIADRRGGREPGATRPPPTKALE